MKIALVLAPGWTLSCPSMGLPLIKAYLKERGCEVMIVDLAARILPSLSPEDRRAVSRTAPWLFDHRDETRAFLERNRASFQAELSRIMESGSQVVGFSAYQSTQGFSEELAARIKALDPTRLIVFGGPQTKKMVDEHREEGKPLPPFIDAFVPGEGEVPMANLLAGIKDGKFSPAAGALVRQGADWVWGGEPEGIMRLDDLPFPDFSDHSLDRYENAPILTTYFSRGCIKKCTFCDVEYYWGKWRNRTGQRVFDEIKHLLSRHPGTSSFMFCDSILNADMKELETFCDLVIAANESGELPRFRWYGYVIVRPEMTPAIFAKMKRSGCFLLWYGIESGSQRLIHLMKKGFRIDVADRVLRDGAAAGIENSVLLIVGFPGETLDDFQATLDFIKRNAPYIQDLSPSDAYTYIGFGTPLYENAFAENGVDPDTFDPIFWRTTDGTNTYPERARRFEAICRTALECKVPIGYTEEKVMGKKEEALRNYAAFLERQKRMPAA